MLWLLSKSEHKKYHNHCPYKITARWGCRTLKSFVRPKFSENALSHLLHWNNFSTVCLCISIIEVVFHSKGRITLAILIWSFPSVCSKMNNKITFLYISLYILVCFGDGSLTSLERLQLFIEVLSTSIFESLFTPSMFTMLASQWKYHCEVRTPGIRSYTLLPSFSTVIFSLSLRCFITTPSALLVFSVSVFDPIMISYP